MKQKIIENLFFLFSLIMLCFSLVMVRDANALESQLCEICAGQTGDQECYQVNLGGFMECEDEGPNCEESGAC